VKRDRSRDRAHLIALLDRFGAQHPKPDATHYFGDLGKFQLKWEQHTEFVTYTAFRAEPTVERPFDPAAWEVFPEDWLAEIPGTAHHLGPYPDLPDPPRRTIAEIEPLIHEWFVPESLAVSRVLDDTADHRGRFPDRQRRAHALRGLLRGPTPASRRIGRIVQRICEIETYKTMSMLGLPRAREISGAWARSTSPVASGERHDRRPVETRRDAEGSFWRSPRSWKSCRPRALSASARRGPMRRSSRSASQVLREERFRGRQTFAEFMMRRFDPAMRTVKSTEARLRR
jgi:uncharacterized membrane-anchored protein